MSSFTSIPILPLSAARDPATKPKFVEDLRHALINVGFLYLSDTGLPQKLVDQVIEETHKFFNEDLLPFSEKEKIEMKNEKSFLGWSRVSIPSIFESFACSTLQVRVFVLRKRLA